jgi:TonB family protein
MQLALPLCLVAFLTLVAPGHLALAQGVTPLGKSKACPTGLTPPDTTVGSGDIPVPPQIRPPLPHLSYPRDLRDQGRGANVVLEIVVEPDGSVHPCDIQVVSATDSAFIAPAVEFARKVRFDPAKQDGHRVRCRVRLPIAWEVK